MDALPAPTLAMTQFLAWLQTRPRSYAEVMDAWRSSCPRLSVWEDALAERLVAVAADGGCMSDAPVTLTAAGRALLDASQD
jgi:hypothetical protein